MKFTNLIKEQLDPSNIEDTIKMLKGQLDQVSLQAQSEKKRREEIEKQNQILLAQSKKEAAEKMKRNMSGVGTKKTISVKPLNNPNSVGSSQTRI
jgi:hypothetical protein